MFMLVMGIKTYVFWRTEIKKSAVVNEVLGKQTAPLLAKSPRLQWLRLLFMRYRGIIVDGLAWMLLTFFWCSNRPCSPLNYCWDFHYLLNPPFLPSTTVIIYVSYSGLTLRVGLISPNFLKPAVSMSTCDNLFPGSVQSNQRKSLDSSDLF